MQDASIQRTLGSVHVPLQSLVQRGGKVDVLCDFGALHAETEVEAAPTLEKASLHPEQLLKWFNYLVYFRGITRSQIEVWKYRDRIYEKLASGL